MDHNAYWVYVIELALADGRKYIGHRNNLEHPLQEHRDGRSPYTR
jgi:predicted GIY-YIG superfamily endonuclease